MPATIPYDSRFTLASVIGPKTLDLINKEKSLEAPISSSQDGLNALVNAKRGLETTRAELVNLGIETSAIDAELEKLQASIDKASADHAATKFTAEQMISQVSRTAPIDEGNIDSPVDLQRTTIKSLPLAANTTNTNIEYFKFDSRSSDVPSFRTQVAAYVTQSIDPIFGTEQSSKLANMVSTQVHQQLESSKVQGTLVLCASCTHKKAAVMAPFTLQIDKAIKIWNSLFPIKKLDPTSSKSMLLAALNESQEYNDKYQVVSGTTFGSSFIALIHVLESENRAGDQLTTAARSLRMTIDSESSVSNSQGQVGVDSRFAEDLKRLFKEQNIPTSITLLSVGADSDVITTDVSKMIEQSTSANSHAVPKISHTPDIDSMLTALDDHLKKVSEITGGAPINYYLKDIDQKMLAQMWVAKYHPGKLDAIKDDNTEGAGPANGIGDKVKM